MSGGLTQQRLKELLDYSPETGLFKWHNLPKRGHATVAGKVAGSLTPDGYLRITIDERRYLAHRLAWLYVYGSWPAEQTDHIDCNKKNNKICNLREATPNQNRQNRHVRRDNRTGLKGVHYQPGRSFPFVAKITRAGKQTVIGRFVTAIEAHAAYSKAANEQFGEFARAS